ncbi:pyridoxal phosphate-dependent aminotransferase [Austwickia sp. TVS 96-490-7B]|uniref:pyridoxal phosphate-dependent aminotransferase n=1 Tax=Austwickia sp. TVS 96-490-7B TaxID=2830843 RepID=UPI001C583EE6|nr:pyridoxal phosphate-dependent aminotransferase [Austwickia sp. TVS 96-490-7B]
MFDAASERNVPAVIKLIFDHFFREDLYGARQVNPPLVLSSGSFDEACFGLPASLKDCVRFALDQNWYGYSDSLGRESTRAALAQLETMRSCSMPLVTEKNVAVVLGGTAAIASIADLLLEMAQESGKPEGVAVAAIPNYPPLIAALARKMRVHLAPTQLTSNGVSVDSLIQTIHSRKPDLVLLQTVVNPWGKRVSEADVARVIAALPPHTFLLLDECHDAFGPEVKLTAARADRRVIAVRSLSKLWAAPGVKCGWMVADDTFIRRFYVHASTTYGGPPSLLYLLLEMYALFEISLRTGGDTDLDRLRYDYGVTESRWLFARDDYIQTRLSLNTTVRHHRELAVEVLGQAGIPVLAPEYSINLVTRPANMNSYQLYTRLADEAGVSLLPGILTMGDTDGMMRVSPCLKEPLLLEGLNRVVRWVKEHPCLSR